MILGSRSLLAPSSTTSSIKPRAPVTVQFPNGVTKFNSGTFYNHLGWLIVCLDHRKIGPTSCIWPPHLLLTSALTTKATPRLTCCKLLMTNVDYIASIFKIIRPSCGSTSNLVRIKIITSGRLVMAGLLLGCSESFKRSAFPMSAVVSSISKTIFSTGLKRS